MSKIIQPKGAFGFKFTKDITIATGTKQKTETLTPEESDMHDISKEGLLITRIMLYQKDFGGQANRVMFSIFNRTNNVAWQYKEAAAFNHAWNMGKFTDVGWTILWPQIIDLTSLTAGGIGLIADFISLNLETTNNAVSDFQITVEMYYNWVEIDSDSYRRLLYARSI